MAKRHDDGGRSSSSAAGPRRRRWPSSSSSDWQWRGLLLAPLLLCAVPDSAARQQGRELMPYRDVQPPAQHEAASSLWLRGLPPLDPGSSALQWCDHYADAAPPIWDTGHAGVALKELMATEYSDRGGERRRALVMSCGTGSDAIFLLEQGFQRVACVEICAGALLQGISKLWRRLEQKGRSANILFVRGDGKIDRWDAPVSRAERSLSRVFLVFSLLCSCCAVAATTTASSPGLRLSWSKGTSQQLIAPWHCLLIYVLCAACGVPCAFVAGSARPPPQRPDHRVSRARQPCPGIAGS